METQIKYRADIDGLRAIAVLSVIGFHYFPSMILGGFVGVDVFFVISGYLITSVLYLEISSGTFSILRFYDRRIRRIFPALLLVIALSLVAGFWLLGAGDYHDLGMSSAYSAASFGNFYFLNKTSYFDQRAILLPLLHLWSLGVEEQFYLVWPLLLFGLGYLGCRSRAFAFITAVVILASFAVAVHLVEVSPKSAFFLPHARAWELGLGAILVFVPRLSLPRMMVEAIRGAGLALIMYSCIVLKESDPFPGINAMAPCLGAALLIWTSNAGSAVSSLLALLPMRYIGKISYSLYLWHWPLLVFYRWYNNGLEPTVGERVGLVALTFVLATLSWLIIEQPVRRWRYSPAVMVPSGLVAAVLVLLGGVTVAQSGGMAWRLGPEAYQMRSLQAMWQWTCPQARSFEGLSGLPDYLRPAEVPQGSYCVLGADWKTAEKRGVLWGDSHSEHYAPMIDQVAKANNVAVVLYRACAAVIHAPEVDVVGMEIPDAGRVCGSSRSDIIRFLKQHDEVEYVLLAAAWSNYSNTLFTKMASDRNSLALMSSGLRDLSAELASKQVTILEDVPQWDVIDPVPCALAANGSLLRRKCSEDQLSVSVTKYHQHHDATNAVLKSAGRVLPVGERLCDHGAHCVASLNGEFLYRDSSHIRRNLSQTTSHEFIEMTGLDRLFRSHPKTD